MFNMYQYSDMALRLSGQTSIFGDVFFVSKSLLGIERQNKLYNLQFWSESLGAMLEYWYIERDYGKAHETFNVKSLLRMRGMKFR